MKNCVIVTAKGENSLANKHLTPIRGLPLLAYPLTAAKQSKAGGVWLSTDSEGLAEVGRQYGAHWLPRPKELASVNSKHRDVIAHAVAQVPAENYVVLLGNTVMVDHSLVDDAFAILEAGECDSCVSVWRAGDDHPYRALTVDTAGWVQSFCAPVGVSSNRQDYPVVYFYDQGVWGFKRECALRMEGPEPWVWLGKRCLPVVRTWCTGRDVHNAMDIALSEWWLRMREGQ